MAKANAPLPPTNAQNARRMVRGKREGPALQRDTIRHRYPVMHLCVPVNVVDVAGQRTRAAVSSQRPSVASYNVLPARQEG